MRRACDPPRRRSICVVGDSSQCAARTGNPAGMNRVVRRLAASGAGQPQRTRRCDAVFVAHRANRSLCQRLWRHGRRLSSARTWSSRSPMDAAESVRAISFHSSLLYTDEAALLPRHQVALLYQNLASPSLHFENSSLRWNRMTTTVKVLSVLGTPSSLLVRFRQ